MNSINIAILIETHQKNIVWMMAFKSGLAQTRLARPVVLAMLYWVNWSKSPSYSPALRDQAQHVYS